MDKKKGGDASGGRIEGRPSAADSDRAARIALHHERQAAAREAADEAARASRAMRAELASRAANAAAEAARRERGGG